MCVWILHKCKKVAVLPTSDIKPKAISIKIRLPSYKILFKIWMKKHLSTFALKIETNIAQ